MTSGSPSTVRQWIVRYLLISSVALAVVGFGCALIATRLAVDAELHRAQVQTRQIADGLAAPLVNGAVRRGDREAIERLNNAMENRMLDRSLTHAALYAADGIVLWSDSGRTQWRSHPFEEDIAALFGTRDVIVVKPRERAQDPGGDAENDALIQVYAGAEDADGVPFVAAAYMTADAAEENRSAIFWRLLPVVFVMLLLFVLATLPLVIGLAGRVDRAARSQSDLLRQSVQTLQDERRRVAQVLHDGVIQDLSAVGYIMSTLADGGSGGETHGDLTRQAAERVASIVQDDLRQLRTLIDDLFTSELEGTTLVAALEALRERASDRYGLAVSLHLLGVDDLDEGTSELVYRAVRESVANVGNHAQASVAVVTVRQTGGSNQIVITVADDGVGLVGAQGLSNTDSGDLHLQRRHLGLRFLARQLGEVEGGLDLVDGVGGGAVLTAWIPMPTNN